MITWRGFDDRSPGPLSLAEDLAEARFAILPIGATEQHGGALPVGMDWIVATELATAVGERLGAYVLPTIPVGTSMEHRGSPGTLWLRPATLAAVVTDIADSAATWGMERLAIISGHGGNFILGPTVRQLNTENPDRGVVLVPERVVHGPGARPEDLHAGRTETSIGCHLFDLEPPAAELDTVPQAARDELNHTPLLELSPTGIWGRPSEADAEHGADELGQRVERISSYLEGHPLLRDAATTDGG